MNRELRNKQLKETRENDKKNGLFRKEYKVTEGEHLKLKSLLSSLRTGERSSGTMQDIFNKTYKNTVTGKTKKIFKIERNYKSIDGPAIVEFEDARRVNAKSFQEDWEAIN